jgi:hypothetical protein
VVYSPDLTVRERPFKINRPTPVQTSFSAAVIQRQAAEDVIHHRLRDTDIRISSYQASKAQNK